MQIDLTDEEAAALIPPLNTAIDGDRFPLSPRVQTWQGIRTELRHEPARPAAAPEPTVYAPSKGRYSRRG